VHSPEALRTPYSKQRRFRRFNLALPVSLRFSIGGRLRELDTISKNVSTGGLLLRSGHQVPLHTSVNLLMQVQGPGIRRPVRLAGEGEVVRVERLEAQTGFAIAIECKRPISELETAASA